MENFPYQYGIVPFQNKKLIFHSDMENFPFTNGKSDFSILKWNFFLCVKGKLKVEVTFLLCVSATTVSCF